MELRVLKYFLLVAREENITRAAQILHITQPTLSRQLMQLEEELGVKLFKRSNHSIILTEDGMRLKRRAQELVSLAEKTKEEFLQREENLSGCISIGAGELLSIEGFAEVMALFRRKYPLVNLNIFSSNTDEIKEKIESGILDFGIFLEPVDISKYDFIRFNQKEEWGILTRSDSELAKKWALLPEDLINRPLFIPRGELVQHEWEVWFGDYYDKVNIIGNYNLLYNTAKFVQKGIGDALCLKLNVRYENLSFVPLAEKLETGSLLVWKKDQMKSQLINIFIKFIKENIRNT